MRKALENDAKVQNISNKEVVEKVEEKLLESFDTTLNSEDRPLSESELIEAMKSYDALLPTVTDPITDRIISTPDKKVKIIGNFGVGFNNIDIDSAKSNNIVVTNTPEVLTDWHNDIAMLLMLGVARRGSEGEFHVRKMNGQDGDPPI